MASSRSGWPRCWRRCWGRSACRAAATPMRSARWGITAGGRSRCRCPPCRRAATPCATSSRWRASPTCCCNPGEPFDYNGQRLTYPEIRLVYWTGGNPFHHHQDLNRLRRAFARVETLVVQETGLDRDRAPRRYRAALHDDAGTRRYRCQLRRRADGGDARRGAEPFGEARDDYAIFAALAERLAPAEAFTEGRDAAGWLRHLYARTAGGARRAGARRAGLRRHSGRGVSLPCRMHPTMAASWRVPPRSRGPSAADAERKDRDRVATIAGFGYADCPGHPVWLAPTDVPDGAALAAAGRQPAGAAAAQPAGLRRTQPGRQAPRPGGRCGCIPRMPRRAASRRATSSGCSTTAAPAWRRRC